MRSKSIFIILMLYSALLPAADVKNFQAQLIEKISAAGSNTTIIGKDDWLFFGPDLRHVAAGQFWGENAVKASQADKPEDADPLPAIVDFHQQLKVLGIELIIVPVPPKALVYPDKITDVAAEPGTSTPPRLDDTHQEFYKILREQGVQVLDLMPAFLAKRDGLYCKQDTHWSGKGCELTAKLLAEKIRRQPWHASQSTVQFATEEREAEIEGDLWKTLQGEKPPKEKIPLRHVGVKSGDALTPVAPAESSPVILLGDSHNLIFHAGEDMLARGAGLPDQLAQELGYPVDLVAVRGSGATPARISLFRRGRANPAYFENKKLVIWVFGAREFTMSSGWRKVPVKK